MKCKKCRIEKPHTLENFGKCGGNISGLRHTCKICVSTRHRKYYRTHKKEHRERQKAYYARHLEKHKLASKRQRFMYSYGLTLEQVANLTARGCEICGAKTRLCVDHCHDTGEVRGCLCLTCNNALGHMREDPLLIQRLYAYALLKCIPLKAAVLELVKKDVV